MHDAAYQFVRRTVAALPWVASVLELGSRNVNGSVRDLFPRARYHGIDLAPGPGVDEIADAADWRPPPGTTYGVVVCCEVLEHTPRLADLCHTAAAALGSGGRFVVTCATDPRAPHSLDGGELKPGEYYRNVSPAELEAALEAAGLLPLSVETTGEGDLYAVAVRAKWAGFWSFQRRGE